MSDSTTKIAETLVSCWLSCHRLTKAREHLKIDCNDTHCSIATFERASPPGPLEQVWSGTIRIANNEGDAIGSNIVTDFEPQLVTCLTIKPCASKGFTFGNIECFPKFGNLQELRIQSLHLSNIELNVGYFQKLKILALSAPNGTSRQLLNFVRLFQNLEDFRLRNFDSTWEDKTMDSSALIPSSMPSLQNLVLLHIKGEKFVDEMIKVYGTLQIRRMDLAIVQFGCMQRLLDTYAATLETLLCCTDNCTDTFSFTLVKFGANESKKNSHEKCKTLIPPPSSWEGITLRKHCR